MQADRPTTSIIMLHARYMHGGKLTRRRLTMNTVRVGRRASGVGRKTARARVFLVIPTMGEPSFSPDSENQEQRKQDNKMMKCLVCQNHLVLKRNSSLS